MATYIQIGSTVTVGSGGAASISFSSIPSTFTDLCVKLSVRNNTASTRVLAPLTFNSSATGYSSKVVYGVNGNFAGSENGGSTEISWTYVNGDTSTASTFSNTEIYIPNYASSNNKSVSSDASAETNSSSAGVVSLAAGLWSNSAAITTITFTPASGTFMHYSTATLYGISKS